MKRILLVLTVALVMAAMMVVTAAPAFAGTPSKSVNCDNGSGASTSFVPSFGGLGKFQAQTQQEGFHCQRSTTPGERGPTPPS